MEDNYYDNNNPLLFERDLLHELNPKLQFEDFDILSKISEEYDLFTAIGFPTFILEEDLNGILNILLIGELPYKLVIDNDFDRNPIEFDRVSKTIVRTKNVIGSYYVDQEIKKMNELINNGKNKV